MDLIIIFQILIFIFGSLVGSYLNVVIYRLPRNESTITPRSKCTKCGKLIKWYENIPVLSFLFLRAKCANCSEKISFRYPLVEILVGFIAYFLAPDEFTVNTLTIFALKFSIACSFLAHFLIDIEHQILPDKINIYLFLVILPFVFLSYPIEYWLVGGLIGFLGPLGVTVLFYKLRGQVGLGGGDIKLYGLLGLLFGPLGIMNTIFMSCMLGSIVGVTLIASKRITRNDHFAFGPFILIVAAIQFYFPEFFDQINFLRLK